MRHCVGHRLPALKNRETSWKGILLSLTVIGCASSYKDLTIDKIKPGEGVAIGRIQVEYKGQVYNENHAVCMNSTNGPCQKLDASGIVFLNLPKGEATLRRLACQDKSPQHFNITGAGFQVLDGVTYIGDVQFKWTNGGGFKVAPLFGVVGALADESSNDGSLKMSVTKGGRESLLKIYQNQMRTKGVTAHQSLVQVGENTSR